LAIEEKVNLSLIKVKIKEELKLHEDYKDISESSDSEIDRALASIHKKHRRSGEKYKKRKSKIGFRSFLNLNCRIARSR
jgi:hypothetical protein